MRSYVHFAPVLFKLNIRNNYTNLLIDCLEIEIERKHIDKNSIDCHEETYQKTEFFENLISDIVVINDLNRASNANMYEEAAKFKISKLLFTQIYILNLKTKIIMILKFFY